GIDAGLRELDAAPVDILGVGEIGQQRAVAAADIEHARARLDHVGEQLQIRTQGYCHFRCDVHHVSPRARAALSRKPVTVANISGSLSRKASWPLSVSISTKLTLAAAAFSAWTTVRLSEVGKSQSEVKDTTQKRVLVP